MIRGLAIAPNNNQVIFAAVYSRQRQVFKSIDGGITWSPSEIGLDVAGFALGFAFDPNNPEIIYLAAEKGLYKSSDAGGSWILKSEVQINGKSDIFTPWAVTSSPIDGTLFLSHFHWGMFPGSRPYGIYRSKDRGETWDFVLATAGGTEPTAIAIAPSAPNIIYSGSVGSGIFKSIDGGDTWHEIDSSFGAMPDVTSITVDTHDAQVVYLGVSQNGIFKTTDGGQTWMPIGTGLGNINVDDIKIDPLNQQVMYLGGGDIGISGTTSFGVFRSEDNTGQSWVHFNDGLGNRSVYCLVIDTNSPQNIYAGTSNGVWKYTVTSARNDYSVSINAGALFTNQTAVTLFLTAPPLTTQMMISNDGGFGGATWEPYVTQMPWTITAYGNNAIPHIVYARFMTSGVTSGQYQDDIILDQTPPTGSIQIASNLVPGLKFISPVIPDPTTNPVYLPIVSNNSRPGMKLVGLKLSASDDLSGVGDMILSNDSTFADGQWQAYATSLSWWVVDNGSTTVNVKYRDRATNESPVYSATTTTP